MEYKIKMTSKGQITLPKEIRDSMGIETGSYLRVQSSGDSIILKPLCEESMLVREYTGKYSKGAYDPVKLREIIGILPINTGHYVRKVREENDLAKD